MSRGRHVLSLALLGLATPGCEPEETPSVEVYVPVEVSLALADAAPEPGRPVHATLSLHAVGDATDVTARVEDYGGHGVRFEGDTAHTIPALARGEMRTFHVVATFPAGSSAVAGAVFMRPGADPTARIGQRTYLYVYAAEGGGAVSARGGTHAWRRHLARCAGPLRWLCPRSWAARCAEVEAIPSVEMGTTKAG